MNKNLSFSLLVLMLELAACSRTPQGVSHIPCRVTDSEYWSFVDRNGTITYADLLCAEPCEVRDGVFSISEYSASDTYALYQYDDTHPKLLIGGLQYVGSPRNGILPVCRQNQHIEVINTKGKTLFPLEQINGQRVTSCAPNFMYGFLIVATEDADGQKYHAVINAKGDVIIPPIVHDVSICGEDVIIVHQEQPEQYTLYNGKGKVIDTGNIPHNSLYSDGKHIIALLNGVYYIYDMKGNFIFQCPDYVNNIFSIEDDRLIYGVGDEEGLMDFDGNIIIPPHYEYIHQLSNGNYLAYTSHPFDQNELFDHQGKSMRTFPEYSFIYDDPDFGLIAVSRVGKHFFILDDDFNRLNFVPLLNVFPDELGNSDGHSDIVCDDYFDYETLTADIMNILTVKLEQNSYKTWMPVTAIPTLLQRGAKAYSPSDQSCTVNYSSAAGYTIQVRLIFTDNLVFPNAGSYAFNNHSLIKNILISCDIPVWKTDLMTEQLKQAFAEQGYAANPIDNGVYTWEFTKDENTFYISSKSPFCIDAYTSSWLDLDADID